MRGILSWETLLAGQNTSSRSRPFSVSILAVPVLVGLLASSVRAEEVRNPFSGDAKAAKAGEFEFRINCAFCHGLGARGGGRGPDLTRVQKKHGNSDADIFRTISEGVPGTAMPPNGATQQGVGMTANDVSRLLIKILCVEKKADSATLGDAAHGKELFNVK